MPITIDLGHQDEEDDQEGKQEVLPEVEEDEEEKALIRWLLGDEKEEKEEGR